MYLTSDTWGTWEQRSVTWQKEMNCLTLPYLLQRKLTKNTNKLCIKTLIFQKLLEKVLLPAKRGSANLRRNIAHQPFHTNGLWNILKYWETASIHKPGKKAKFPICNVRFVCLITSLRCCEAHLHNVCKVMFVEHCMAHASRKGARHRSGDWTGDQTLGSYLVIHSGSFCTVAADI